MFKNIQKYLLLNYPLLWNTRVVPTTIILLVINLIFFFIGLEKGKLNFFENNNNYSYDNEAVVIFFSILVSILILILWIVFYFKNNSFKSFYPKRTLSLFKEWSIIVFICFLISLFSCSYYYGKDVRLRSYFTEQEAKNRCELLSKASFFVEGSYSNNYNNDYAEAAVETEFIDSTNTKNDSLLFNGKNYSKFSLLNKNLNSYNFFDQKSDSIRKNTIKTWLVNQQKDSIKSVFKKYLAIAKEHKLEANIDENKWFDLIYDYPTFLNYREIGSSNINHEYYENINQPLDSINKYIKVVNGVKYEYYKHYVPEKSLNYNYSKISEAWVSPNINFGSLLIPMYFSIGLSLLIFGFRVTSGRNWLIAVISLGVISIVLGIFTIIINSDYSFASAVISLTVFTFIYFFTTISRKKSKNISGVILNAMLWLFPSLLPLIYYIILEILQDLARPYHVSYKQSEYYPAIQFMEDFGLIFGYLNIVFIVVLMLFLSIKIKQWRSLAEG
jgi:hypothetical protein